MKTLARVLATWFFCGYAPKAPGTVGSLAALAIAWLLHRFAGWPPASFGFLAALLVEPAIWSAGVIARETGLRDPQFVVIDEVIGQWITLAGVAQFNGAMQLNSKSWLAAFALFRLFDIWKPPPIRRLERLHGGIGIVADDAMAGIYGALVLLAAGWFNLY